MYAAFLCLGVKWSHYKKPTCTENVWYAYRGPYITDTNKTRKLPECAYFMVYTKKMPWRCLVYIARYPVCHLNSFQ